MWEQRGEGSRLGGQGSARRAETFNRPSQVGEGEWGGIVVVV